jgi:UDP-N-acetylmuramate dehydrogenase
MKADEPTLRDVREAVCAIRRRKLPDPAVTGNAGSFFKNPLVNTELLELLKGKYPDVPYYIQTHPQHSVPDSVKIPAAWLIEQCGWKGFRTGDAGVHPEQPLVLVNYGNATGREILELAKKIEDSVYQKFGIKFETEVNIIK